MAEFLAEYWQLLIPIVLIDLGLRVVALVDLVRREQVTGDRKWLWALVIFAVNFFGSILYLVLGRKE